MAPARAAEADAPASISNLRAYFRARKTFGPPRAGRAV
jgi:hypothetical protein